MSDVTISISTENAAFDDSSGTELARILLKLAAQMDGRHVHAEAFDGLALRDSNGNTVGTVYVR